MFSQLINALDATLSLGIFLDFAEVIPVINHVVQQILLFSFI